MAGPPIVAGRLIVALAILALAACDREDSASPAPRDLAAAPAPPGEPAYASLTGDPVKGETVFRQCAVCHALEPGVNRLGPSLAGVIGREAGSVEGFSYSPANRASNLVWSEEQLYAYLRDPRGAIPGTTMAFAGLADPQDRADVIAYIKSGG